MTTSDIAEYLAYDFNDSVRQGHYFLSGRAVARADGPKIFLEWGGQTFTITVVETTPATEKRNG